MVIAQSFLARTFGSYTVQHYRCGRPPRIAALGIIFYLAMDIAVHWELRYLRKDIGAKMWVLITAIVLDLIVLAGFVWFKLASDILVIGIAGIAMVFILVFGGVFLGRRSAAGIHANKGHKSV